MRNICVCERNVLQEWSQIISAVMRLRINTPTSLWIFLSVRKFVCQKFSLKYRFSHFLLLDTLHLNTEKLFQCSLFIYPASDASSFVQIVYLLLKIQPKYNDKNFEKSNLENESTLPNVFWVVEVKIKLENNSR